MSYLADEEVEGMSSKSIPSSSCSLLLPSEMVASLVGSASIVTTLHAVWPLSEAHSRNAAC